MASASSGSKDNETAMTVGWIAGVIAVAALVIIYRKELNVTWFQGILHEEATIGQFLFVTCLLGGWAAWMTGRACAQTWRPMIGLILYLMLLGIAVRFIHHALFDGTMFTLYYYVVDTIILIILGVIGFKYTRTNQMVTQYHWLYERVSPLSFKAKG